MVRHGQVIGLWSMVVIQVKVLVYSSGLGPGTGHGPGVWA